jgi:fatty acid-binding protein DegV
MPKPNKSEMPTGQWIDQIVRSTGQYVRVETLDGVIREGRLSSLRTRELTMFGAKVLLPTDLELNGDPMDTIALDRVDKLNQL